MEEIESLKMELGPHCGFNYETDNLIKVFSENNLLFKRVLKLIFFYRLRNHFESKLNLADSIEEQFPRRWRLETVKEFELATTLKAPKMILSKFRANVLVFSFLTPIVVFLVIFYFRIEYLIIPVSLLGAGVYLFLATIPAIVIGLIFPRFFSPLDWPEVRVIEDFLDFLVIRNWDEYRKDSFSKTLIELKNVGI